jgi:DNA-binding GntR family transcriptional regulator
MSRRSTDEAGTTADAVYEALRRRIIDGKLAPGQRLRSDALATMLKVSRTPVREALRKLEAEGLIGHSPRGGLIVQQLSEDDLAEIFHIREALEGLAARLAADNATPSEVAELQALIEDMQSAVSEPKVLRSLTGEFHRLVAQTSHNRRLAQSLKALQDQVRQVQHSTLYLDDRPAVALDEHKSLVRAIERRDGDQAEQFARAHRRKTLTLRRQMIRDELRKGRLVKEN